MAQDKKYEEKFQTQYAAMKTIETLNNIIKENMYATEKYRINVLSKDENIKLEFKTKSIAIEKMEQLKKIDKGFIKGWLEERINGNWVKIWYLK